MLTTGVLLVIIVIASHIAISVVLALKGITAHILRIVIWTFDSLRKQDGREIRSRDPSGNAAYH